MLGQKILYALQLMLQNDTICLWQILNFLKILFQEGGQLLLQEGRQDPIPPKALPLYAPSVLDVKTRSKSFTESVEVREIVIGK